MPADITQTVKELNALGIPTEPIRTDPFTGGRMTFFRDPDVDRMRKMELLFNYCDELDLQILHLLEKNCSYAAISEALFASETAVKYRVRNMENLCGVNSRAELKELLWGVF